MKKEIKFNVKAIDKLDLYKEQLYNSLKYEAIDHCKRDNRYIVLESDVDYAFDLISY